MSPHDKRVFGAVVVVHVAAWLALVVAGCGNITTVSDADASTKVEVHHDEPLDTSTNGQIDGSASVADARDAGGPTACIGGDAGAPGFAYNPGCDGGTTLPTACHASCSLDGQHFVGCAWDDRVAAGYVVCHASCAECAP
jgi:hypothetical protein